MTPAYLEFELAEPLRFERLVCVFDALKQAKERDSWGDQEHSWLGMFDEAAKATFWWPTADELAAWQRKWLATPVADRLSDPSLQTPWDFASMIEAFENGDYALLACRRVGDKLGHLEFEPHGWPYGGTGCMQALIEAFGGRVTGESGT